MGKLRSKLRYAVHRYINNELTPEGFKAEITEIMREFDRRLPKKLLCQDMGLIVQEREQSIPSKSNKFRRIWALLDEVEPSIRKALDHWREIMSK